MSKEVLFYLMLDSLGIALTAFIGKWLCRISDAVTNPWVSNGISLIINFLCACALIKVIKGLDGTESYNESGLLEYAHNIWCI